MSTQRELEIPFEIQNAQESVRFVELPPQLLELITTNKLTNLALKAATSNASDGLAQSPANAVLCTDNQTYQVRQVQSSNSVLVLEPSKSSPCSSLEDSIESTTLSALAQCTVTLELMPHSPASIAFLKRLLPVYSGPDSISNLSPSTKLNRAAVLENASFSTGEYEKAWMELCSFELEDQAWRPATSLLTSVWKSIISAATVRSIDLGSAFATDAIEGAVEEDGYPRVLFQAIIDALSLMDNRVQSDGYALLDKVKCVRWVGAAFLESQLISTNGISVSDFIQQWQDHLPESWRPCAELGILKGMTSRLPGDRVIFDESASNAANLEDTAVANASGKNARKWHEKFKNARR